MKRASSFFFITAILMVIVDQAVKAWVRGAVPEYGTLQGKPFPGVFELTLTYNKGVAFGFLNGKGTYLAPIAIIIAGGATWYSLKHKEEGWTSHLAMSLLASGATGNLIDRVWLGKVTDMFYFRLINFPVFNVADSCITIATILLIGIWIFEGLRHDKVEVLETPEPKEATV